VRLKKKLDWKYLGLGLILARIRPSAYRVDLLGAKGVHPVFYALLLEPYHKRSTLLTTQDPIQEPLVQGLEDSYNVEEVRDRRQRKDRQ
jgi:hypothetical protein